MALASMTITLDPKLKAMVDKTAAEQHVSVEDLLRHYLEALATLRLQPVDVASLPLITKRTRGILPAISDEAREQIIDKHRRKKYGK